MEYAAVAQSGRAPEVARVRGRSPLSSNLNIRIGSKEFNEFYGIMIGDGTVHHSFNCRYFFTIAEGDEEYALYIANLIKALINKEPKLKFRSKAYRIEFKSKHLFNIVTSLGFPIGRKSSTISIPLELMKGKYVNWLIRGIFDTDGSIFFSSKPGIANYPTLEITSKSLTLLKQIKDLLRRKYDITSHVRKSDKAYKIAIYGRKELAKWIKFINSSHRRKLWLLARAIRRS